MTEGKSPSRMAAGQPIGAPPPATPSASPPTAFSRTGPVGPTTQMLNTRKNILVATYDMDLALRLKQQFTAKNLRTTICSSFTEMLRLINEIEVAVVVLDFSIESLKDALPEVDNMQALREMRRLPKGTKLPVISTTSVDSTLMVNCLVQGYSAFLKRAQLEEKLWKYMEQFLANGRLDLNKPL